MLRADAPSEPGGWRVVLGSGGASPYREFSSHTGRLTVAPKSRRLILQLLNSCLKDFRRIRLRRGF
jgi:hypothetical protein